MRVVGVFFFKGAATTGVYALSLHGAVPVATVGVVRVVEKAVEGMEVVARVGGAEEEAVEVEEQVAVAGVVVAGKEEMREEGASELETVAGAEQGEAQLE